MPTIPTMHAHIPKCPPVHHAHHAHCAHLPKCLPAPGFHLPTVPTWLLCPPCPPYPPAQGFHLSTMPICPPCPPAHHVHHAQHAHYMVLETWALLWGKCFPYRVILQLQPHLSATLRPWQFTKTLHGPPFTSFKQKQWELPGLYHSKSYIIKAFIKALEKCFRANV
jgi:hypothetical protein